MSKVTNVIVSTRWESREVVEALERPIKGQALRPITGMIEASRCDDCWGGSKNPEVFLWAAAFNHVDWVALFQHLESVPWQEPRSVQVFIRAQEGPKLGLYEMHLGRLVPINPEAAIQVATIATDNYLVALDGTRTPLAEGRAKLPRTEPEIATLIHQVVTAVAKTPDEIATEVRWILNE